MNGLYRVITKNNIKQLQAFQGTEAPVFPTVPVGAILPLYTTTVPVGYLPCNGAEYDTEQFPLLYAVLNSNKLPDLRECTLVGAGTNDTDAIADHDVYTINQFKDDQIQHLEGNVTAWSNDGYLQGSGAFERTSNRNLSNSAGYDTSNRARYHATMSFDSSKVARDGTTTHGKQKGVFFVIKATSAVNDAESNAEITNAIADIRSSMQEQYDTFTENTIQEIEEAEWRQEYELYSGTTSPVVGTTFTDSLLNYDYVKFYTRRNSNTENMPVAIFEHDQIEDAITRQPSWQMLIHGYSNEYQEFCFSTNGLSVTRVGASVLTTYKIVGVGKRS